MEEASWVDDWCVFVYVLTFVCMSCFVWLCVCMCNFYAIRCGEVQNCSDVDNIEDNSEDDNGHNNDDDSDSDNGGCAGGGNNEDKEKRWEKE